MEQGPDALGDFSDADGLAGEHDAEVDLAPSNADAPVLCDLGSTVTEGVLRAFREMQAL